MRYQQFASHAYYGAARPVTKMASKQDKAFCLLRVEASRSANTVQRDFHARFKEDAPHKNKPLLAGHWHSLIRFSESKQGSTTHLIGVRKDLNTVNVNFTADGHIEVLKEIFLPNKCIFHNRILFQH
jgi:hypothetical protein